MLTLGSREWRPAFGFSLGQLSRPQQDLCEALRTHVSVGRIHVLTLEDRTRAIKTRHTFAALRELRGKETQITKRCVSGDRTSQLEWGQMGNEVNRGTSAPYTPLTRAGLFSSLHPQLRWWGGGSKKRSYRSAAHRGIDADRAVTGVRTTEDG